MPGARCTRGLVCKIVQRNAHEHTGSAEAIRHSLRKGAFGDVIALTSLDILSECSHLCRDSRWCLNGEKYLVL
jgi:hypothetical protein